MTQAPSRALVALLVAAGLAIVAPAQVLAAEAAPAASAASGPDTTVRSETFKQLRAAQDAQAAKDWVGALAKLKEAEAVGNLTPYESYLVDQGRAVAYYSLNEPANAAIYLRKAIDSSYLPAKARIDYIATLFQVQVNDLKDYKGALATMDAYQAAGGTSPNVLDNRAFLLSKSGDTGGALAVYKKQVADALAAGQKPDQRTLQVLIGMQEKAGDDDGMYESVVTLARYYPRKDVWGVLLQLAANAPDVGKYKLDVRRLHETVVPFDEKDGDGLLQYAEIAGTQGYPAEARPLFERAFERKMVPAKDVAAVTLERDQMTRALTKERAADKANEASMRKANDYENLVAYGLELFFDGQVDRGISMMESAVRKGTLKDMNAWRLRLGMAQLRAGLMDEARKTFQSVTGTTGPAAMARVYLTWIDAGAKLQSTDAPKAPAK